jgi:hypothetical protein
VAAADEEQALNPPASPTTDDEDSDAASASPLTPSGSPFEDAFGAAHSTHAYAGHHAPAGASSLRVVTSLPVRVKTEDAVPDLMAVPYSHGLHPSYAVPRSFAHAPVASSSYSDRGMVLAPDLIPSSSYQATPVANDTGSSLFPPQSYFRPRSSPSSAATPPIAAPAPVHSQPNRFVGFNVWSDHALICSLAPQTVGDTVRAAFQVSLQLPGPMNIVPAVTVAARWSQAICTTVVMHGGEIKYQTSAHIPPPQLSDPSAPIVACLPDPWLPVSQWMDYRTFLCLLFAPSTHADHPAIRAHVCLPEANHRRRVHRPRRVQHHPFPRCGRDWASLQHPRIRCRRQPTLVAGADATCGAPRIHGGHRTEARVRAASLRCRLSVRQPRLGDLRPLGVRTVLLSTATPPPPHSSFASPLHLDNTRKNAPLCLLLYHCLKASSLCSKLYPSLYTTSCNPACISSLSLQYVSQLRHLRQSP